MLDNTLEIQRMPSEIPSFAARGMREATDPKRFFDSYWQALAGQGWEAVVLHGWQNLPERIHSDIDYAVRGPSPGELLRFLGGFSREHGGRLVQVIEHEPGAIFCVCQQAVSPFEALQLDVTWNYRRQGHSLVPAEILFENSRAIPGKAFRVPSPGSEFTYLLAKAAAKGKDFGKVGPRLVELLHEDSEGCRSMTERAFGDAPGSDARLETWSQWFANASAFRKVRHTRRFGIGECQLYLRRLLQPTGFQLRLFMDAKASLLEQVIESLRPSFRNVVIIGYPQGISDRLKLPLRLIRTTLVLIAINRSNAEETAEEVVARAIDDLAELTNQRMRRI